MRSEPLPMLPQPRGPVTEAVISALRNEPHALVAPSVENLDLLSDPDAQLALTCS